MVDPFLAIASHWLAKINLAWEYKKTHFQNDADECMRFYNGPYFKEGRYGAESSYLFPQTIGTLEDDPVKPSMIMPVNKAAECVQIFGPMLYHRNPNRLVTPRKTPLLPIEVFGDPNDPNVQQFYQQMQFQVQHRQVTDDARAALLEQYLNYTPTAMDLKGESRLAIDECIIKGMGVLWHDTYEPKGAGFRMGASFYDTVDNLVMDPDVERRCDCKWVARRCIKPVWEVEQKYKLEPGSIRGSTETLGRQANLSTMKDGEIYTKQGWTNDVIVYWEIWSKMGTGGRLEGITEEAKEWDRYGDFCYIVVADGVKYPLNLPPEVVDDAEIANRLRWYVPFWADDGWPFTEFVFHDVPRQIWPMSHLKPAMGELKFMNWAYSFIASKMKQAIKDKVAIAKSAEEEVKRAIMSGTDYELISISGEHGKLSDIVSYLQHPPFQADFWTVLQAVEQNFAERTGLSELMYGETATQMRSAEEANVKSGSLKIRPDDMANKVEDAMTVVARKEALMARWLLDGKDVQPIMGDAGAMMWDQFVVPADPGQILHQLEYRIEAGSIRKPNKDKEVQDANQAMQTLFTPFWQYAMTSGDMGPANALLAKWCKASDMEPIQIQPPPPQPDPAQQQAQLEAQKAQQEMQVKQQAAQIDAQAEMQRMQMDRAEFEQEMSQDAAMYRQDLKQSKDKAKVDLANIRAKKSAMANGSK